MYRTQCHLLILTTCFYLVIGNNLDKNIIIRSVECTQKSKIFLKIECFADAHNTITMHLTTNDEEIHKMIGVTEVILTIHGRDSVMRYNNIRLDICKLLSFSARRSILAFFYQSIRRAAINFPKRCPFKTNTTYTLKQMSFDVNVFPFYVPEYNFTFIGHFFANDVLTMDVKVTGALCKKTNNCSGAVGESQP